MFQTAVSDSATGEVVGKRFSAERQARCRWAEDWRGNVAAVAIEATTAARCTEAIHREAEEGWMDACRRPVR